MSTLARIIDANANRTREAMRVAEDAARFGLNDEALCSDYKQLRHDFRDALDQLPAGWVEANRDITRDVGTKISTVTEMTRTNLAAIAAAASKRLTESLRSIEEATKTIDSTIAAAVEAIRYRAYKLETVLNRRLAGGATTQWGLCVLLTESLCRRSWREVLAAAIDGGAACIQVREQSMQSRQLLERVREVIELARPAGVSVIVNDRADIAMAAEADGVHLGQNDLAVADVRRIAGRTLHIGVSTHSLDEATQAVEAGADYCGIGAMFQTCVKPEREPAGSEYLREFLKKYPTMPHLAIGGITPANAGELIAAGCRGVAVSSAVCDSDEPGKVVEQLRELIRRTA